MAADPNAEAKAAFTAHWTGHYARRGPNLDHQVVIAAPARKTGKRPATARKPAKPARPDIPVIYHRA